MKKKHLLLYGLVFLAFYMPMLMGFWADDGTHIQPTFTTTPGAIWESLGTITENNGSPAVAVRDYSTLIALNDANCAVWTAPEDVSTLELRFQTTADADSTTVELWLARGSYYVDGSTEDSFTLATSLVLTGGTQVGPNSNVFVDTIANTDTWISSGAVADSAANRICHYVISLHGYKKVVFVTSALEASSTLYIDGAWY